MLSGKTPQVKGQDEMVKSGNYNSFIRVVSIDELKIQSMKDYHASDSNSVQTASRGKTHNIYMPLIYKYIYIYTHTHNIYINNINNIYIYIYIYIQYLLYIDSIIKKRLILILKNKQERRSTQNNKCTQHGCFFFFFFFFFTIILSTRLGNHLHALKINSSDILFHSSAMAVLSEPIFR